MYKTNTKSLIILQTIGIGFVAIPQLSAVLAGRDGLIAIILATLAVCIYSTFIFTTLRRYGELDLFWITESTLGKFATQLLCYGFTIKCVLFSGFCLRILGETVTTAIESPIPAIYIMLAAVLCVLYAAIHGLEVCSRLAELCLVPFILVITVIFVCGLKDGKTNELLPLLSQNGKDILKATAAVFLWFYPIMYILPNSLNKTKACVKVSLICGGIIAVVFAVTLMHFGIAQFTSLAYPVLEIMYSVSLPTSFIERQEGLMLGIWVIGIFFSICGTICKCTDVLNLTFKGTSRGITAIICILAILATAFVPKNETDAYICMLNTVLVGESIYFVGLPSVLCLYKLWEDNINVNKNT